MNFQITSLALWIFLLPALAFSLESKLPDWVVNPVLDEGKYGSVICSHEALDPEKARQIAEDKCYLAASRSQGVSIKVNSKSTQTLTASEVSESVESVPVVKFVRCDFQNQFIERNNSLFRVWLKCRYLKESIKAGQTLVPEEFEAPKRVTSGASSNSVIRLLMLPKAETILIQNDALPERIIRDEIEQNMAIDIRKGDRSVIVRHHLYKDYVIDTSSLRDGDISTLTVYLEKEL